MAHPFLALDVWTDPLRKALELSKVWERFLSGTLPVPDARPTIISSWQRCLASGVHPHETRAPMAMSEAELDESWRALPVAAHLDPLIKQLSALAEGSGHLVVITDGTGRILRMVGDRQVRRAAEKMNFVPGSNWSEGTAGTNAIGTALIERHPIQVFAAEHFCEPVHRWTCSATPILDPSTGTPLAVIDMTGLRETVHPHTLAAVTAAARYVEDQLGHKLQEERLYLVEHYLNALASNSRLELAVLDRGGRVVRACPTFENEGWVDKTGRLVGLPAGDPAAEAAGDAVAHAPMEWEAEGRLGRRRFVLQPVYRGGTTPVGALVRMVAAGGNSARRAVPPATAPGTRPRYSFAHLLGRAPSFAEAIATAAKYATSDLPVLIEGESGTGKELLAQAVHMASPRAPGPFVAVNCGAIPKDLVASEFFGYEGGTFTGAAREGRAGKFEAANGGTIFLDEVGEMPLDAQVYLLRVLEQSEVMRLGAKSPVKVNVRVIAATNRDLRAAVQEGSFRQDLYYRLQVLSVRMPPVRERAEDVPLLMEHLLERACRDLGRSPLQLSDPTRQALIAYHWPGNVREMRNLAFRLALTVPGPVVGPGDLPPEILQPEASPPPAGQVEEPGPGQTAGVTAAPVPAAAPATPAGPGPGAPPAAEPVGESGVGTPSLPELERRAFAQAWVRFGGHAAAVARALGISRATAYRKARQYGLLQENRSSRGKGS